MAKIKLTKNELKRQKDALKRFERFLPMLQLKKQQLQIEIRRIQQNLAEVVSRRERAIEELDPWVPVLGASENLSEMIQIEKVTIEDENVAGVALPGSVEIKFYPLCYDLFLEPLWLDGAVAAIRNVVELDFQIEIHERQAELVARELDVTSQRVNLFERVRIPETRRSIQKLRTFLGDQDTAAVVRGKISKRKRMRAAQNA